MNAINNDWRSPLHLAVQSGNEKLIKLLVDNGADIKIKDVKQQSPYDIAKSKNNQTLAMLKPKLPPRTQDKVTRPSI